MNLLQDLLIQLSDIPISDHEHEKNYRQAHRNNRSRQDLAFQTHVSSAGLKRNDVRGGSGYVAGRFIGRGFRFHQGSLNEQGTGALRIPIQDYGLIQKLISRTQFVIHFLKNR